MKYGQEENYNYLNTYDQMNSNGQFNSNRQPTARPYNPKVTGRPNSGALGSNNTCKKPVPLIVVIVLLAIAVAVLGGVLFVITRRYKQALQQVIHMNELYSAKGIDKNKTLPLQSKMGQLK